MKKTTATLLAAIATLSAGSAHASYNLLDNGSFDQNIEMRDGNWHPTNWSANNHFTLPFDVYYSEVSYPDAAQPWIYNLSYPIALEGGVEYRFKFSAKVKEGTGKVIAGWGKNEFPWDANVQTYDLTDEWQTFEYVGEVSYGTFANSRIIFDYGSWDQDIFIDDVIFQETGNLLTNGRFEAGLSGWGTNGQSAVIDGVYVGSVATAGEAWHASASQPVTLEAGATYRLTFQAKAGDGQYRRVWAGWGRNQAPWEDTSLKEFTLSDEWRTFEYVAAVPYDNATNSRVIFDYGHLAGDIYLDQVILEKVDDFRTDDGTFDIGVQPDGSILEVATESVFNGYLSPSQGQTAPYHSWITTRPEPHDVSGPLLKNDIEVVGTYVQDCDTLEWVNVDGTVFGNGQTTFYEFNGDYQGRLSYPNITTNEPQAYGNFVCDKSEGGMMEVFYNDQYTLFPEDGYVTFGYVLRHVD